MCLPVSSLKEEGGGWEASSGRLPQEANRGGEGPSLSWEVNALWAWAGSA